MVFLWNPNSGKGKLHSCLSDVIRVFSESGYLVTAVPTRGPKDATRIVKEFGRDCEILVSSGGDGTLTESISGMLEIPKEERPVFGYIPSGTTNDVARSLGISRNPVQAAKQIADGKKVSIDIGKCGKQYFTYCAAFGAFTEVTYMTPQEAKHLLGHQAYVLEGMKSIQDIRPISVRVELDGNLWFDGSVLFAMVTNSQSVGGFKYLTGSSVKMNDGLFEVSLVPAVPNLMNLDWNSLKRQMLDFRADTGAFLTKKAENVYIKIYDTLPLIFDGEYGGNFSDINIKNLKEELEILIPNNQEF